MGANTDNARIPMDSQARARETFIPRRMAINPPGSPTAAATSRVTATSRDAAVLDME